MAATTLRPLSSRAAFLSRQTRRTCSQRTFSSSTYRRQEIQDAYILSAVRTPVGVVSGIPVLFSTDARSTALICSLSVQWGLHHCSCHRSWLSSNKSRLRPLFSTSRAYQRCLHGSSSPSWRWTSPCTTSRHRRWTSDECRGHDDKQSLC